MQQWNGETRMNCLQSILLDANGGAPALGVDCTLSLGTPSTRQLTAKTAQIAAGSSFSLKLDLVTSPSRVSSSSGSRESNGGDHGLHPRRCANCDTTSTPLWRNGPRGPKSLCNACGIRYKKEERRAASSAANAPPSHPPPPQQQQQQYLPANYSYRQAWGSPWQHLDLRFRE